MANLADQVLLADVDFDLQDFVTRKKSWQMYVTAPYDWLMAAASLPGKAGAVAIRLAFLTRVRKANPVRFGSPASLKKSAERRAIYRGITALERSGLISVERVRGRSHLITLQFDRKLWTDPCWAS
jgi:hypothetical protein